MCGIAALFAYHPGASSIVAAELMAIRDHMSIPGLDTAGAWLAPFGRLALGHRWLVIIDLERRPEQPMQNACGPYRITFNGGIYNYLKWLAGATADLAPPSAPWARHWTRRVKDGLASKIAPTETISSFAISCFLVEVTASFGLLNCTAKGATCLSRT